MNHSESILDRICIPNSHSFEEQISKEYNELIKGCVIDRNAEYPDPEYLIEIGGVPTMPKGNLIAVSAKWKNGKTFFCDILSAIFLGSDQFASCHSLQQAGKVLFFDTEQAKSDTKRIQETIDKMTPESRHNDFKVFCLREVSIDSNTDDSESISRFDLIKGVILHEHPDLVIIDGIADLIYNYNDVIESQDMVNRLAILASEHNCAIVVVMHQNKGFKDKNMKGHLGTMLYQKCSDVFNVEKCDSVFVASHYVSRHRYSQGICFKLDAKAIPMDAVADRQLQAEIERQQKEGELWEMLVSAFPEDGTSAKRSEIAEHLVEMYPFKRAKAYQLLIDFVKRGWLIEVDRSTVKLNPQNRQIDQ